MGQFVILFVLRKCFLAALSFVGLAVGVVSATAQASECPITERLLRDLQSNAGPGADDTSRVMRPMDALAVSIAELNGVLGGVPVLTFGYAQSALEGQKRECLRAFGRLARATGETGPVALRIIGHADSVDSDRANLIRS